MKFPGLVLAAVALTLAAQATNNAMTSHTGNEEQGNQYGTRCGVGTLRGTYTLRASGYNIVAGVAQPKAIVEIIEFNGDGTLAVPAATVSANGVIVRTSNGTGTYTVADDCSGTVTFAGPVFDIFISRDAESISMIQTNPNTVMQGIAAWTGRDRGEP